MNSIAFAPIAGLILLCTSCDAEERGHEAAGIARARGALQVARFEHVDGFDRWISRRSPDPHSQVQILIKRFFRGVRLGVSLESVDDGHNLGVLTLYASDDWADELEAKRPIAGVKSALGVDERERWEAATLLAEYRQFVSDIGEYGLRALMDKSDATVSLNAPSIDTRGSMWTIKSPRNERGYAAELYSGYVRSVEGRTVPSDVVGSVALDLVCVDLEEEELELSSVRGDDGNRACHLLIDLATREVSDDEFARAAIAFVFALEGRVSDDVWSAIETACREKVPMSPRARRELSLVSDLRRRLWTTREVDMRGTILWELSKSTPRAVFVQSVVKRWYAIDDVEADRELRAVLEHYNRTGDARDDIVAALINH